ncbi:MAG: DUF393 domain-containing protein [Gammaproteobacteria bacterium]|nr:DUF393 domain-containing protein [Gammaproteobacteria bacterium]
MNYTIFYDANCKLCSHEISLIMKRNENNNLIAAPLDDHIEEMKKHNITREAAMELLHIVSDDGRVFIGMDSVRLMYRQCGWRWQATALELPIIRQLSNVGYRIFAKYRYLMPRTLFHKDKAPICDDDSCNLPPSKR